MSDEQNGNFTGSFKQFLGKLQSGEISGSWLVSLKSYQDKYLSALPDGDVKWDQDQIGEKEWFKVVPQGGYKIALKSCRGMYLSANADIGGTVQCDKTEADDSTIWAAQESGDTGVALKSCFGKYLHPKKTGEVTATHNEFTEKETFTVVWTNKEEK